jgi:hypothetical protein
MEYKQAPKDLVIGQRYYIVPESRLFTNKLATKGAPVRFTRDLPTVVKPVPEAKKNTILLLSAVVVALEGWSNTPRFDSFWNKDGTPSKDTRKAEEKYVYFSFTATPVPSVMGSTVTAEEAKVTIGELAENVRPASMRPEEEAAAGAGSASPASAPLVPELRTAMTPAVKKTTDELVETLRLGESRVSVSDILKRKNTPQLENLANRLLQRHHAIQILPSDYQMPPNQYYGVQTVNVYSPYGAIELLIERQHFTADQKERYIREMVLKGADPSKALVTAILYNDLRSLNVLLDLGADPNYVSEYKSTNGTQRFLTSPLLAAIPARITEVNSWANVQPMLETLTRHRTFVMDAHNVLTRANRNSLPDETPVYETIAYITHKILVTFHTRLLEHLYAIEGKRKLPKYPGFAAYDNTYTEMLQGWIRYLEDESVKQGALLAEPGGPAYEEARARAYGRSLGTREEQLARNAAANEAVSASMRPASGSTRMALEHGIIGGGTRKHRNRRRQTRRR